MRTDLVKLSLTVALAAVLAGATVVVYRTPTAASPARASNQGSLLFQAKGCSGCHTIDGIAESGSIGPNLTFLAERAVQRVAGLSAVEYVTQSIRDPSAFTVSGFSAGVMPTLPLSDSEVAVLVEFLLQDR